MTPAPPAALPSDLRKAMEARAEEVAARLRATFKEDVERERARVREKHRKTRLREKERRRREDGPGEGAAQGATLAASGEPAMDVSEIYGLHAESEGSDVSVDGAEDGGGGESGESGERWSETRSESYEDGLPTKRAPQKRGRGGGDSAASLATAELQALTLLAKRRRR